MKVQFPIKTYELDKQFRYKVLYGGRSSGKSHTVAKKLILRAIKSPLRILCTRQLQNSINDSVHKLLSLQIEEMGLVSFFSITKTSIKGKNGSEFVFKGILHNVQEIKSTEGIDICFIEEGESITEHSFNIIDPTIRKPNSEIWIVFNTRYKQDYLYSHFISNKPPPNSLIIKMNYNDNPWFPDVLNQQMEHMKKTDYNLYRNIWLGELLETVTGSIFGKQISDTRQENRIINIVIQRNCEVDVYFDLGKSDNTAMWFVQRVGSEIRLIDFYEASQEEVEHYTKYLKSLDYNYGTFYMPHDADHDRLGMSRNIKQQFLDGGIKPITIVERIPSKRTAIELAREIFPQCYFHSGDNDRGKRVAQGIEHLSLYRYKFNDKNGVFNSTPLHDIHSNGADAFQAIAQAKISNNTDKYSDWSIPINN